MKAFAALALVVCAAWPADAAGQATARILLVSGSGAEDRAAAAMLADSLRRSPRLSVFTSDDPAALSAVALARYDALVVDCDGAWWGDGVQRAVEAFVREGKGLAAVRAGDCAAGPEAGRRKYAALAGVQPGAAAPGKTGHHPWRVRWATPPHALAPAPGGEFLTVDDTGAPLAPLPAAKVVAVARPEGRTDGEQPVAWTASFGAGRVFQTRQGRNRAVRQEPEFLAVFTRAVEWAATGSVAPAAHAPATPASGDARAIVVTGGHNYDTSFYTLFEDQPGIVATIDPHPMPYRRGDMRKRYDTLVLYDSMQEANEVERKNLRDFVESGKGVVILHHGLVDYSDWQWWWEEVMGARWLKTGGPGTKWKTTWKHDVEILAYPVGEHPVTAGVGPMRIWDETYKGMWLSPDIKVLMRTDEPTSDGPLVWLSPYRKSRVVIIELGHDRSAHLHPGYRKLVTNAVRWSAGKE